MNFILGKFFTSLMALVIISPYIFVLLANPYVPGNDEVYQLQGAYRLAHEHEYSVTWAPPADLAVPKYDYLTTWPPGYSLAIFALLKIGLSLDASAKLFKLTVLVSGLSLWFLLANRFLSGAIQKMLFALFICVSSVYYAYSPTDLFCWAAMPTLSYLMLFMEAESKPNMHHEVSQLARIVLGSLLMSVMIAMKYQSIALLPASLTWLILISRRELKRATIRGITFSILPLLTFIGIACANLLFGGSLSSQTDGEFRGLNWDWRWIWQTLAALVLSPLYLHKAIAFMASELGMKSYEMLLTHTLALCLALAAGRTLYTGWQGNIAMRRIIAWLGLVLIFLLGLLGLWTALYFPHHINEPAVTVPRYYWSVVPLLLITILASTFPMTSSTDGANKLSIAMKILIISALLLSEGGVMGYSVYKNEQFQRFHANKSVAIAEINRIRALAPDVPAVVISFTAFRMFLWEDFMPAYRGLAGILNEKTFFSKPTWVFVLRYPGEEEPGESGINDESLALLRMEKLEKGLLMIYWRKFDKGMLKHQV